MFQYSLIGIVALLASCEKENSDETLSGKSEFAYKDSVYTLDKGYLVIPQKKTNEVTLVICSKECSIPEGDDDIGGKGVDGITSSVQELPSGTYESVYVEI